MQSYKNDELVSTDLGTINELKERIKELEGKITHSVIGKIPEKDTVIVVNGLKFKITFSSNADGCFKARILR